MGNWEELRGDKEIKQVEGYSKSVTEMLVSSMNESDISGQVVLLMIFHYLRMKRKKNKIKETKKK